ncbi:hypothetical protein LAUMK41_03067 [Mycobacterium attenuatum]|nr:hypothetical protein LAUMK41_03067 [Mycobacterium attenuatum]
MDIPPTTARGLDERSFLNMARKPKRAGAQGDSPCADSAGHALARTTVSRRRRRIATATLGALAFSSGITGALNAGGSANSYTGVGRLALTLIAHDGFKLDSCTANTNDNPVNDLTDNSLVNSLQNDTTTVTADFGDNGESSSATQLADAATDLVVDLGERPVITRAANFDDYDDSSDDEIGVADYLPSPGASRKLEEANFHPLPAAADPNEIPNDDGVRHQGFNDQYFVDLLDQLPYSRVVGPAEADNFVEPNPATYITFNGDDYLPRQEFYEILREMRASAGDAGTAFFGNVDFEGETPNDTFEYDIRSTYDESPS